MLATESHIHLALPQRLFKGLLKPETDLLASFRPYAESDPSPFSRILDHHKRNRLATVLPSEVALLKAERLSEDTLVLVLAFDEYLYKGSESHFYHQHHRQQVRASIDTEHAALRFTIMEFPDAHYDC